MKLAPFIAIRYLFSKKTINAINIISLISVIGVMVSSAALVIVLSFYNGMEQFILSMYSKFAPELRIEPTKGKLFSADHEVFQTIQADKSILNYAEILEDKVLVEYDNHQFIAVLKGMEINEQTSILQDDMLYSGTFESLQNASPYAILGAQLQAQLQVNIQNPDSYIQLFSPRKSSVESINPMENVNIRYIQAQGLMNYEQGFDNLVITPIDFAKDLLDEFEQISAIEIYTKLNTNIDKIQVEFQKKLGSDFIVKNRQQQNPTLYKTVKSEKWIVFFILTLIGIIATFNIIGSITMLAIDKKDDMQILASLGASQKLIQQIFFIQGMFISFLGSVIGIFVGYIFCLLHQHYGFVRTNDLQNSLLDIYPIDIRYGDFLLVFTTVLIVSSSISYISSRLSLKGLADGENPDNTL